MGPNDKEKIREEGAEQGSDICNDKSELSIYKDSSEISTTLADSAYSSQGTSTYGSLTSMKQNQSGVQRLPSQNRCSFATFKKLSSKASSNSKSNSSHSKTSSQPTPVIKSPNSNDQQHHFSKDTKQDTVERDFRRRKQKPASNLPVEGLEQPGFPTSQETKALKVATLSQALGFVDQYRKSQSLKVDKTKNGPDNSELNHLASNLQEASQGATVLGSGDFPSSLDTKRTVSEESIQSSTEKKEKGGFCVAVSLYDGQVTHTTPSMTAVLGYPKDMWVGRSFIDFVYPDDRGTFISQVTENINLPLRSIADGGKNESKEIQTKSGNFFCRIRLYNGLKSGFSIKERKTRYNPFKLSVCFSEMDKENGSANKAEICPPTIYLFITAVPIVTAYSKPFEEGPIKLSTGQIGFISKHNADCSFTWFDDFSIAYTGYLPQDILGDQIFKYIHPDDLATIKETFEEVMKKNGKPAKSKPVRFKVNNGDYILISSWWSSFINPWSRQLEFVHGKHTILQGPESPELFTKGGTIETNPVSMSKEVEAIQDEIKCTLKKAQLTNRQTDSSNTQVAKNKKELSSFMGSLLEEVAKAENTKFGRTSKPVVIGNISPHYSDSSETPPSYNQLTYNENLTRFFNSQPKTLTEDNAEAQEAYLENERSSNESKEKQKRLRANKQSADGEKSLNESGSGEHNQGSGQQLSGEGTGNNSSILQTGLSAGQLQQAGDDGMLSQDGSGSGSRLGSGSRAVSSSDTYKPPPLTEELLLVHNKDMEKKMLKKFKEAKKTGDMRFVKDSVKQKIAQVSGSKIITNSKEDDRNQSMSTKNPGKQDLGIHSDSLHTGQSLTQDKRSNHPQHLTESQWVNQVQAAQSSVVAHPDLQWISQTKAPIQGGLMANPLSPGFPNPIIGLPAVYIPIQGNTGGSVNAAHIPQGFMLQQGAGTRYVPLGMMYSTQELNQEGNVERKEKGPDSQPELPNCLAVNSCMIVNPNTPRFKRPASRATSIKGEPGSALDSNASAPNSVKLKQTQKLKDDQADSPHEGNESDPNIFSGSTSSSLYSFLKSSEEFHLKNSSSDTGDYVIGLSQKQSKKRRPVLPEPFWNLRVEITKDMMLNYQMVQEPLQTVLQKDKEKLASMTQPDLVDEQLGKLFEEFEDGVELEEFLEDFECPPTDTDNSDEGNHLELEEKVIRRRRQHLEKMNIFMEAEAPFPLPPNDAAVVERSGNLFGSPQYSKGSQYSGSQKSGVSVSGSDGGSQKSDVQRKPSKKLRFGDTSSLGTLSKRSFEDILNDIPEHEATACQNIPAGEKKEVAVMTDIPEEEPGTED